ncbi:MAG: hypothetical protein V7720_03010 [Halioglobus sp.]
MLRTIILLSLVVVGSVMVKAEVDPGRTVNAALVQIQDCLDMRVTRSVSIPAPVSGSGLSVRGLGATLGIGLMTIMFFVPAALLSELLMNRGEARDSSGTV